ncbi:hypothetical protein [Halorussus marinus]|uniref:hypothetical protein n=1 Tax=Halorussus marinus TaxID=2505976 RepID=UPI00106E5595|nr:hypothetical protein [Halorussus marinus]
MMAVRFVITVLMSTVGLSRAGVYIDPYRQLVHVSRTGGFALLVAGWVFSSTVGDTVERVLADILDANDLADRLTLDI